MAMGLSLPGSAPCQRPGSGYDHLAIDWVLHNTISKQPEHDNGMFCEKIYNDSNDFKYAKYTFYYCCKFF